MNDRGVMGMGESSAQLNPDRNKSSLRQGRIFFGELAKVQPRDELHYEVKVLIRGAAKVVYVNDIRMIESSDGAGFPLKTGSVLSTLREVCLEYLNSDLASHFGIFCQIDAAAGTAPQPFYYFISINLGMFHELSCSLVSFTQECRRGMAGDSTGNLYWASFSGVT